MQIENELNKRPDVAYHDGGVLFAGDEKEYSPGWYIFLPGIGAFEVDVDLQSGPESANDQ